MVSKNTVNGFTHQITTIQINDMRYLVTFKESAWQQTVFADNKRQARKQITPWAKSQGYTIDEVLDF